MPHVTGLFKVLGLNGEPIHGGSGAWSLPTQDDPGEWMPTIQPICCMMGYHLTSDPLKWWRKGCRIFVAEQRGILHGDGSDKAASAEARLLEEVTLDWFYLTMFPRVRACLLANLSGADLSKANLSGADLSKANLSEANLSEADLSKADLSKANLSKANLSEANLSEADLSKANLSEANLSEANLSKANLSEANLSWADLTDARVCQCNSQACSALRDLLQQLGWVVSAEGLLAKQAPPVQQGLVAVESKGSF